MPRSPAKQAERRQRLIPNGYPRWVRIYDNGGETADRYTCVFTGNYNNLLPREQRGWHHYVTMSEYPEEPQGVCLSGCSRVPIDVVGTSNWAGPSVARRHPRLGLRIRFKDLNCACRTVVRRWYDAIWQLRTLEDD
jgi:hypothetical protein